MKTKIPPKKIIVTIISCLFVIALIASWVCLAVLTVCGTENSDWSEDDTLKYIAHRGYSSIYAENSKNAFLAASTNSFFQGMETDVWRTTDGVFVCSHNVNPFEDKSIKITEKTYDEIRNLNIDISAITHNIDKTIKYTLCTFEDFLNICFGCRKIALIELKQEFTQEQIVELLTFMSGKISYRQVIFGSFIKSNIDSVINESYYYKTLLFTAKSSRAYLYSILGYNLGVNQNALKQKTVNKAHDKESFVAVYNVNTKEQAEVMISCGTDYIITDFVLS